MIQAVRERLILDILCPGQKHLPTCRDQKFVHPGHDLSFQARTHEASLDHRWVPSVKFRAIHRISLILGTKWRGSVIRDPQPDQTRIRTWAEEPPAG